MSRPPRIPYATPEESELPGRPGYTVELESRFDALEEDLASRIVPWDTDAEIARIAREAGLPDDARFIAAAKTRLAANTISRDELMRREAEPELKRFPRLSVVRHDEKRAQEEADAKYDEENSRW